MEKEQLDEVLGELKSLFEPNDNTISRFIYSVHDQIDKGCMPDVIGVIDVAAVFTVIGGYDFNVDKSLFNVTQIPVAVYLSEDDKKDPNSANITIRRHLSNLILSSGVNNEKAI